MYFDWEKQMARFLAAHPQGAGIEELVTADGTNMPRRTMLRKLDGMIENGWIERIGRARATRYRLTKDGIYELLPRERTDEEFPPIMLREPEAEYRVPPRAEPTEQAPAAERVSGLLPEPVFSEESKAARDIVREPMAFRKAVGYRREFLEAYQPNVTWYLPETLRRHLRAVGQSDDMAALPPGTHARRVLDRLLIDLSWNSSRLEGNTYSLLETDHLLARGATEDPARYLEAQMLLNHKAAIEFLVESPDELGYNRYTMLNLHAILTEGLLNDPSAEGRLRLGPVGIGGSVFHPLNNPPVLEECIDLILKKTAAISDPLEQAFFLMVQLPYLQPFEDGNKRVSRLAANLPLFRQNLAPLSFVDVSVRDYADGILSVYELNRVEVLRDLFAWAYERSSWKYAAIRQEIGDPEPMRARYREEIKGRVRDIVTRGLDKPAAARELRKWTAEHITASNQSRFIELVEGQLLGLNEGNIARMRLRPSEFHAWQPVWKGVRK